MTKETIETIRFALRYLMGLNQAIATFSDSSKRKKEASNDIKKCDVALAEFEMFVIRHVLCGADK